MNTVEHLKEGIIWVIALCALASIPYYLYDYNVKTDIEQHRAEHARAQADQIMAAEKAKVDEIGIKEAAAIEKAKIEQAAKLSGHVKFCVDDLCGVCTFKPEPSEKLQPLEPLKGDKDVYNTSSSQTQ